MLFIQARWGWPIIGSSGFLDSTSDSVSDLDFVSEALLKTRSYETPSNTIRRMIL
jgi:hypothetical protein